MSCFLFLPAKEASKGRPPPLVGQNAARIYLSAKPGPIDTHLVRHLLLTYLVHELGNVWGLGHPDEEGQVVDAVMNSTFGPDLLEATLQPDDIAGMRGVYGARPDTTQPMRGFLENPSPGTHASGISVISGWVCEAGPIVLDVAGVTTTAQVVMQSSKKYPDGADVIFIQEPIPYGSNRQDTKPVCGDADNGFGLLFN